MIRLLWLVLTSRLRARAFIHAEISRGDVLWIEADGSLPVGTRQHIAETIRVALPQTKVLIAPPGLKLRGILWLAEAGCSCPTCTAVQL